MPCAGTITNTSDEPPFGAGAPACASCGQWHQTGEGRLVVAWGMRAGIRCDYASKALGCAIAVSV